MGQMRSQDGFKGPHRRLHTQETPETDPTACVQEVPPRPKFRFHCVLQAFQDYRIFAIQGVHAAPTSAAQ
eukprot:2430607-Pyramimonas_sp.AAC.1